MIRRASDFFQDLWAEVTHGAKNGGSFSEMMGPSIYNIKLTIVDIRVVYFTYTLTQTLLCIQCICILTADYTVKPVLSSHSKKEDQLSLNAGQKDCRMGAFCNPFDLH